MPILPVSNNAAQITTAAPQAKDQFSNGIRLLADGTTFFGAVTGGQQVQNGLLLTSTGAIVYVDATAGLPDGTLYVNGLPISPAGALCVSTGGVDEWVNGLPMASNGALCVEGISPTDYAEWNSLDKNALIALSGSDLVATKTTSAGWVSLRANQFKSTGKWMYEIQVNVNDSIVGFGNSSFSLANYVGATASSAGFAAHIGQFFGSGIPTGSPAPAGGLTVYSLALDLTGGKGWIARNGVWLGDPVAGTGNSFTWTGGSLSLTPAASVFGFSPASQVTLNCGQNAFTAAVPTGFNAGWYL